MLLTKEKTLILKT